MNYLMARSTALDGDWMFDNDLARFGDPWKQPVTRTGRKSIGHPIGPPLVWTPLIWTAQLGAVIANTFGADIALHGYTLWHQRFVFLTSALFACGAVLLGLQLARRILGGRWSPAYAAVAILLGTPLTYYATYMPSYAHAMDSFACAAFLAYWAATVGTRTWRRWLILGGLLGFATLVRVQELAFGIVVAIEVVTEAVRATRTRDVKLAGLWLAGGAVTLATTIVVFTPQLLEWHLVFGSITELPQGAKYTRLEAPMIPELLWSPRNGWFSTTPLAYLAVIGLFLIPRAPGRFERAGLVKLGLVAVVAIQVYLNSTILDWWGSAAFGQRRMCNVTLPLVVGMCALIWRLGRAASRWPRVKPPVLHAVVVVGLGTFVMWNLGKAWKLRAGKAAPSELSTSCCDNLPGPLQGIARAVYSAVGDPFEFPANLVYAIHHDVSLQRWDETVGNYPLVAPLDTLLDDRLWQQTGKWPVGSGGLQRYLVGPWSPPEKGGTRKSRSTLGPRATVLVPNLMPYGQRVTVWLAPLTSDRPTVSWNGEVVAEPVLTKGWNAVSFDLPDIGLHTNELTIETSTSDGERGVQVSDVELGFLPP